MKLPASNGPVRSSRAIKVLADMNIVERRRPQDGQMQSEVGGPRARHPRRDVVDRVRRDVRACGLLDKSQAFFKLSELGMPADTNETYRDLIRSPYGMVVCAGPTGSGKTTTLYATLAEVNDDAIKVTTIEDPVEYVIPSINQIQINEQAGVTFASGLRAILRQDPDSILVGEIRDVETARIAVQAALTGHFVMSSLHATDASAALHRFLDMGIEPFLLASSLLGVVGQRLVRRNCPHCIEPYYADARGARRSSSAAAASDLSDRRSVQRRGLQLLRPHRLLRTRRRLRGAHASPRRSASSSSRARRTATSVPSRSEQGMRALRDQAIRLVAEGTTTIAEVLRTVYVL